jgi:hypothetical protein
MKFTDNNLSVKHQNGETRINEDGWRGKSGDQSNEKKRGKDTMDSACRESMGLSMSFFFGFAGLVFKFQQKLVQCHLVIQIQLNKFQK